jgi:hypothetical protein
MNVVEGIPIWGSPIDDGALSQIKTCALTADRVALMADHHAALDAVMSLQRQREQDLLLPPPALRRWRFKSSLELQRCFPDSLNCLKRHRDIIAVRRWFPKP